MEHTPVLIAEVLLVIVLSAAIHKLPPLAATALFFLYSGLNGILVQTCAAN